MKPSVFAKAVAGGILFLSAQASHALFEVRAHYGFGATPADEYNSVYYDQQDGPKLKGAQALGADILISPPMFNLGVGVRLEVAQEKDSAFGTDVEMDYGRTSVLVNYRLIDTMFYAGPIASFGVKHRFEMGIPTDPDKISSESATSYTLGVEGGAQLGIFLVGAEVGYQSLKFKDLTELDGSPWTKNGQTIGELDLSGIYYKLMFGIGF